MYTYTYKWANSTLLAAVEYMHYIHALQKDKVLAFSTGDNAKGSIQTLCLSREELTTAWNLIIEKHTHILYSHIHTYRYIWYIAWSLSVYLHMYISKSSSAS